MGVGNHEDAMVENRGSESTPHDHSPSGSEAVVKLRLELKHRSLEELEEYGLVRWDRDENIVLEGPKFDEKKPRESTH